MCDKEAAESCDAGLCTDCCKSNSTSFDCCDDHWIDNAGSEPDSDSDKDDASPDAVAQLSHRALIDMRQLNADIERNRHASASDTDSLMVAMCDTAPRFYPPSNNGGWILASAASNGTQPHTVASIPYRDDISQAYSMVTVCDTALRFHPPPDIDGLTRPPAASNGKQYHTMATLPARTIKKFVQNYEDVPATVRAFVRWLLSHEGR